MSGQPEFPPNTERERELADAAAEAEAEVAEAEAAVQSDLTELEQLQGERAELVDTLRRVQADFENYRKRVLREQTALVERATERLVQDLLPVLDSFDGALGSLPTESPEADKVQPDDKEKMDAALKELKDALAGTDIEAVKRGHENLVNASQEFAQRLYAAAQAQQSAAGGGPSGGSSGGSSAPNDDEVADAEIVDEPGEQSA